MSQRKKLMVWVLSPILILYIALSNIWSPLKWGVFITRVRELAPICFYGQVVDLDGTPMSGVEVQLEVSTINWWYILGAERPRARVPHRRVTDELGRFQVEHERGYAVIVRDMKKVGYRFKPTMLGGGYGNTNYYFSGGGANPPHVPDSNRPVVFEMEPKR